MKTKAVDVAINAESSKNISTFNFLDFPDSYNNILDSWVQNI